jgi:drug/metabolite transporter (DMT)-like permease
MAVPHDAMTAKPPAPSPPYVAGLDRPGRGILLSLASTLLFSILWCCVKDLSERYSIYEVAFFRSSLAMIPIAVLLAPRRSWGMLRVRRMSGHLWRAGLGVIGMVFGFLSYHLMPLADAVAISFMSPLVVTALSVPLLGERVGIQRWSAVIIGFGGVLIIVNPSRGMFTPGVTVAICGAVASALSMITIRQLNRSDPPLAIVFYFTLFTTLFTAVPLPFVWVSPSGSDWGLLVLMGLTGGVGQYFMTRAYGLAPAAVISPFTYSGLLWATVLGWFLWSDVPKPHVFAGAAVVIASGLYILYRETRKKAGRAVPSVIPPAKAEP